VPGQPPADEETRALYTALLHRLCWQLDHRPGEALEDFLRLYRIGPEFTSWYADAMLSGLAVVHGLRTWWPGAALRWLACLILLALRAAHRRPGPDLAADAVILVPSAPLVRAHAILTAAPPSSRAQVPAGAPA
jgi:hypothetical protein